ncbi:hypothetical protein TRFO_09124 [Tritrichomonas foetus]|uniref:C2 NT-type domain-containing protein n=1 Tax=Tritrichomonas foetus TaxID=1144522 RepID=A0A1J4JFT0_9EUKA|nr:hypothetical protein TRFO_09124 [Tritrichomonas foetus]|eukprot:OHS97976.1 hypothetical protein TRFO_09124 [Tritrichomonas foetus]
MPKLYLNIISLSHGHYKFDDLDKIRVNVTSYPMREKQEYFLVWKDTLRMNHKWVFEYTENYPITKLLITIRRKSFFDNDPILGTFEIDCQNIPLSGAIHDMIVDLKSRHNSSTDSILMNCGQVRYQVYYDTPGAFPVMDRLHTKGHMRKPNISPGNIEKFSNKYHQRADNDISNILGNVRFVDQF